MKMLQFKYNERRKYTVYDIDDSLQTVETTQNDLNLDMDFIRTTRHASITSAQVLPGPRWRRR